MNPFEKIFNYQIVSRLEDAGTFMVTAHERAWLRTMLEHTAATDAFSEGTLAKLQLLLDADQPLDFQSHIIEKARSREKHVYHPLLRPLRRFIMSRSSIRVSYSTKNSTLRPHQPGLPYKLEYSMVKREWYLLWYHLGSRQLMSTRLENIVSVEAGVIEPERAERVLEAINQMLESRKIEAVIRVVPAYNQELSRILYAFSCFEKDVRYDAEQDTYDIRVCLLEGEQDYLLSKIRFLGKRVRVLEGEYLQRRMLESAGRVLGRYG
ncbi:WYL domain-containing protein [Paenibacillus gansuensis]|uniref:WYL domain-containing protein n=1 Tax=Paenibacillus gansuensis TaxID=306542 RepID=A0ABW5P9Y9_9BACL